LPLPVDAVDPVLGLVPCFVGLHVSLERAEAIQRERDKHEATADAMLEHVPRHLRLNELGGDELRDGR
jgi:hypothetical protein